MITSGGEHGKNWLTSIPDTQPIWLLCSLVCPGQGEWRSFLQLGLEKKSAMADGGYAS